MDPNNYPALPDLETKTKTMIFPDLKQPSMKKINPFIWLGIYTIGFAALIISNKTDIQELENRRIGLEKRIDALESPRTFLLPDEMGTVISTHPIYTLPDPTADVTITLDEYGNVVKDSGTATGTFEDFIDSDGDKVEIKPAGPNVTLPGTQNPPENQIPNVTLPGKP